MTHPIIYFSRKIIISIFYDDDDHFECSIIIIEKGSALYERVRSHEPTPIPLNSGPRSKKSTSLWIFFSFFGTSFCCQFFSHYDFLHFATRTQTHVSQSPWYTAVNRWHEQSRLNFTGQMLWIFRLFFFVEIKKIITHQVCRPFSQNNYGTTDANMTN